MLDGFDARESTRLATIAELKALRAQINPHFLFNALTTLAEMAHSQPATERAILNLSRVFRYALDATQHELVPLGEEIDAIRAYLEIEAERFDDRLRFDIAVPSRRAQHARATHAVAAARRERRQTRLVVPSGQRNGPHRGRT